MKRVTFSEKFTPEKKKPANLSSRDYEDEEDRACANICEGFGLLTGGEKKKSCIFSDLLAHVHR